MKQRILVWIIILVTPTTLWFIFTDDGQDAFNGLTTANQIKHVSNENIIDLNDNAITSGQRILIPVNPRPTSINPAASISVRISPRIVGAVLINNQQRKTGFDSFLNKIYKEIAGSSLDINESDLVLTISPSSETEYKLRITGNPGGSYNLSVKGVSPDGQFLTIHQSGMTPINRSSIYDIDLNKVKTLSFNRQNTGAGINFISFSEEQIENQRKESLEEICNNFHQQLKSRNIGTLTYTNDEIGSEGSGVFGCHISLYDTRDHDNRIEIHNEFYPHENIKLFKDGWVADLEAGGPDGDSFRIRKLNIFCFISQRRDGGNDEDPSYVPSNEYAIHLECGEQAGI